VAYARVTHGTVTHKARFPVGEGSHRRPFLREQSLWPKSEGKENSMAAAGGGSGDAQKSESHPHERCTRAWSFECCLVVQRDREEVERGGTKTGRFLVGR